MTSHNPKRHLRGGFFVLGLAVASALAFGQAPVIRNSGVLNSADYSRSFAPGALISVFGTNLATGTQQASALPLSATMGGASVEIASNSEQCPLWYVSPTQINAQLPYDVATGPVQIRVRTAAGVSNTDTITVSARAPKIFALDFSGQGPSVVTDPNAKVLTTSDPVVPARNIVLWMNSMGAVSGNVVAGQPAPGLTQGSQPATIADVTATVANTPATVTFAGLSPGSVGLYQVNITAPFAVITGPADVAVTVGGVTSQAKMTVPFRQLGYYSALLGGKAVNGQTLNGVSGSGSALAFRQSDAATWGNVALNAWTKDTGNGSQYSTAAGLGLTLMNGTSIVYDNNGIETGATANFYNNAGGGPNSQKPGLSDFYSMSNYFPLVFAGYFKLSQATTVTSITGYFDTLSNTSLPFDPANPYVRYRMNIWASASGPAPKETNNFTGDVFSSDTTAGTFSYSTTSVDMVSSDTKDAPKPVYRLTYRLSAPLTLPAGEYWFGHDASIRANPGASSTARAVLARDFQRMVESRDQPRRGTLRFTFLGREMTWEDSWELSEPLAVRPDAPVMEH